MSRSEDPIPHARQPKPDLSSCEQEPIHIPGAIQPHGALLAALGNQHLISHASANLAAVLGRPAASVLGRPLADVVGEAACHALLRAAESHSGSLPGAECSLAGPGDETLYLHAHCSGRHVCVDIEPMLPGGDPRPPATLVQSVLDAFATATTGVELCELAVRGLQAITGYDRVMAYRFHDDGHGEVIAEARAPEQEPFLGLHYPATDIPAQARRLYLRQRTGSIANCNDQPAPLLVDPALDDGAPLDLTHSALRSASPIHRAYMRNMKSAASLTVGPAQNLDPNGQSLWGMLVCHHATPRIAGSERRAVAGMIGQIVSLLLPSLGAAEVQARRLARHADLQALVDALTAAMPLPAALAAAEAQLLGVVNATGAALRFSGAMRCVGRTPPAAAAERALAVLRAASGEEPLAVDDLGLRYPELASSVSTGAGALLLPLRLDAGDAILWFRPELPRTVVWGGNPREHAIADPVTGGLSPRASFAAWEEAVSGHSMPWTDVDLTLARELRGAVEAEAAQRIKFALRDSEARLERTQEIAGVGAWELELSGGHYAWSRQLYRLFGVPLDFKPSRQSVVSHIHPTDHLALANWDADLAAGRERDAIDIRIIRPDGELCVLRREGHAVVGPDGSIRQLAGTMQDVTRQRQIERRLTEAQKMEAVGQLAGGLAHNFNNLLGVIIGNVELLLDGMDNRSEQRELVEEILKAAGQGAELTSSMLAFGRRGVLRPTVADLNAVLSRQISFLQRTLGEAIAISAKLSAELWPACIDTSQAADVLSNLVINARDAMPSGGRLLIETANVTLDAADYAGNIELTPGDYVMLVVTDTGTGMTPEVLARAAEPFFTTKEPDKGTGLGLSMCFGFARQSGGCLSIASEIGCGTTVRLYLPRTDAQPPSEPAIVVVAPRGSEAILLVEDDDTMRLTTARSLAALGYQLHLAANGDAALAVLRSGAAVDLLLTDIVMPGGMNGFQLAQAAQALNPRLKVLLTTGFADLADDTVPAWMGEVLRKPYRREELATRIRAALTEDRM